MPIITLEPGGSRPPTPTEQEYIRSALGVDTLTLAFGSPSPTAGSPAAKAVGQWLRLGTADANVWDWYQWNGVSWRLVRRDGVTPGGGGEATPTNLGTLSSSVALDRSVGSAFVGQRTGGATSIALPTNMLDGQQVSLDLYVTANDVALDFHVDIQMPTEARAMLPASIEPTAAVRITIGKIRGQFWLLSIDGPVAQTI